MRKESEDFLTETLQETLHDMDKKYRHGDKTYGGNLMDLPLEQLLEEALKENIDQCFYIKAALKKLRDERDITK